MQFNSREMNKFKGATTCLSEITGETLFMAKRV